MKLEKILAKLGSLELMSILPNFFCKNHTLTKELIDKNKVFAEDITKSKIKNTKIQSVFQSHEDDEEF